MNFILLILFYFTFKNQIFKLEIPFLMVITFYLFYRVNKINIQKHLDDNELKILDVLLQPNF